MAKNKIQSNIEQLEKIGDLLAKRDASDRPVHPVINDKVKSVFEESFNILKQKQNSMSEATDYQKKLLNRLLKTLVDIRKTDDFDSLDVVRKEVIKIEKQAEEDTNGNPDIKKFISEISSKIYNDTKLSNKDKTMSFVKGTIKQLSPFAFFDMSKLKDKRGSFLSEDADDTLENIDASVAAKKETFDNKKKSKSDKLASQAKQPTVSQKSEPTKAKVGETFIDEKRTTYEKYATGWRDIASGKMATKAEQERINSEYNKQMGSPTPKVKLGSDSAKKSDNSISKITELKIDKAIIKELKIDKEAIDKLVDAITSRKGETETSVEADNISIPDVDIDRGNRRGSRTPKSTKASGLKRVLGSAKSLLGSAGRVATAAAPFAIPAAVAYGAANAIDYGAGKLFGFGKDENGEDLQVDEKTDDANWNKMNAFQKMQSGLARGVEYAGSAVGLSNIARSAEVGRIKRESEFLNGGESTESSTQRNSEYKFNESIFAEKDPENYKKFKEYENQKKKEYSSGKYKGMHTAIEIKARNDAIKKFEPEIEKAGAGKVDVSTKPTASKELTTDIDKMTKSIDSKKTQSAAPVVVTNPAPAAPAKETVIMPVKGSVRPSDSSFNRFQDRVFAGF